MECRDFYRELSQDRHCGREDKEGANSGGSEEWGCDVVSTETGPALWGP